MSPEMWRVLIAGALFVHGIGHTLGYFRPARSWLLTPLGEPVLRLLANLLWSAAALGFLLSFLAFLGVIVPGEWWRPLATISALVSLAGLIVFFGNWPAFNAAGAIGFNLLALYLLVWRHWPPLEMFGK